MLGLNYCNLIFRFCSNVGHSGGCPAIMLRYSPTGMKDSFPQALGVLRKTALRASSLWGLNQLKRVILPEGHPSLGGVPTNSGQLSRGIAASECPLWMPPESALQFFLLPPLHLLPSPLSFFPSPPPVPVPSPVSFPSHLQVLIPRALSTKPLALQSPS